MTEYIILKIILGTVHIKGNRMTLLCYVIYWYMPWTWDTWYLSTYLLYAILFKWGMFSTYFSIFFSGYKETDASRQT